MATSADSVPAYRWVLAFTVLALLLWLFSKTRLGYTVLYYTAALVLLTMVLVNYQAIATALNPLSEVQS